MEFIQYHLNVVSYWFQWERMHISFSPRSWLEQLVNICDIVQRLYFVVILMVGKCFKLPNPPIRLYIWEYFYIFPSLQRCFKFQISFHISIEFCCCLFHSQGFSRLDILLASSPSFMLSNICTNIWVCFSCIIQINFLYSLAMMSMVFCCPCYWLNVLWLLSHIVLLVQC